MATSKRIKNTLHCLRPASWWGETWREGLVSGNGIIGASVYGGVADETILLNQTDLSWQGRISVVPDVSNKLKEVRAKLKDGLNEEAVTLLPKTLIQKNFRPQPHSPLPLCVLNIKTPLDKPFKDYSRSLNMENGEITVSYLDGSTRYTRELFVDRSSNSIVYEITRTGTNTIDAEFSFDIIDKFNNRTPTSISLLPEGVVKKYEKFFMYFAGRNDNGTDYGAVARISYYGGTQIVSDNSIRVTGANSIFVIIKLFAESKKDKEWLQLKNLLASNKDTYEKMLKKHAPLHLKYFDGVKIDLGDIENENKSIDELMLNAQTGNVPPILAEKMWNYGRYLMISSTSEVGRIMSPYGLWNGEYKAYKSELNFSGQIESAYAHIFSGDMCDFIMPLFNYIENNIGDFKDNAMRLFSCRGVFIPSICANNSGRLGSVMPHAIHFTGVGGYIAEFYYNYYLYTQDTKFLKTRALPFMKEVALFYEEFLKIDGKGKYCSSPSYSPNTSNTASENAENDKDAIGVNAEIDFSIARAFFTNLIDGCTQANMYKDEIEKWKDMLLKIPTLSTNSDGFIKEYNNDAKETFFDSASVSSLYGAYASKEFDFASDAETIKIVSNSLKKKFSDSIKNQTAFTMANMGVAFARFGQKSQAQDCLNGVIRGCTLNNLMTAEQDWRGMGLCGNDIWAPIQLNGNMAVTNLVQEMLVYSKNGVVKILPSVPSDWSNIDVKSIGAVGGLSIDINTNSRQGNLTVALKTKKAIKLDLYLPDGTKKVVKSTFNNEPVYENATVYFKGLELAANKSYIINCKYTANK